MFKIFSHSVPRILSGLFLVELMFLIASTYFAGKFDFLSNNSQLTREFSYYALSAIAFALIIVFCMAALGAYDLSSQQHFPKSIYRILPAFAFGFLLVTLVFNMAPDFYMGRGILILSILLGFAGILLIRALSVIFFDFDFLKSRVVFLGDRALAKECIDFAESRGYFQNYDVIGIVPLKTEDAPIHFDMELPNNESLMSIARKYNVDEIVISVKNWRGVNIPIQQLLECKINGIKVTALARFFEREAHQIRIHYMQPSWLVFGEGFDQGMLRALGKRALDLIASILLFAATLPIMLVTALCIYVEDRGPILYMQERVGKNGRTFKVLKFRSMRNDAEKSGDPQWAKLQDPRVTKVGRFIRKVRIDELPQILNVLKGEMSFVGPRPERPFFVRQLCEKVPFYDMRHSIKPGITGFAQVRYQYGATVEDAVEKLQYDLYYVKNHSLFLDFLIIIHTIQVVLSAKGSR